MRYSKIIVVCIIVLTIMPIGLVKGDGIPLIKQEFHGTLRENRQLAYISVNDDGTRETLNLFLSVVSLYPGNNVSVLIPLMTKPQNVFGQELSEWDFRRQFGIPEIEKRMERQNHCGEEVVEKAAKGMEIIAPFELMGIFGLYTMVIGMGGSGGLDYYEISEGVSFEVQSFDTLDSIAEYYTSLGLEVPEKVKGIIDDYGEFHLGIINATTRPPIDEETFAEIRAGCPRALDEFRDFVEKNPTIEGYGQKGILMYDDWMSSWSWSDNPELSAIISGIHSQDLKWKFNKLISATYGFSEQNGVIISFDLPLEDGQAYFPLGTTPAWSGVHKTMVIFEIDDGKYLDFNKKAEEAFYDSNHYYKWDFQDEAPDYDLIGKVRNAGMGTSVSKFTKGISTWVYENATSIGVMLDFMMLTLIWTICLWVFFLREDWWAEERYKLLKLFAMGFGCMALSLIGTLVLGIVVAWIFVTDYRYRRTGNQTKPRFHLALEILFILLLVGQLVIFSGLAYASSYSLEYHADLFALSLVGAIMVLLILIIHFYSRDDPEEYRIYLLIAWGTYTILFLSTLYIIGSQLYICLFAFIAYLVIQTLIFLKVERIIEWLQTIRS